MARKSESSLRILLILSAIDLLSSAVTAGLVLFVVLVGGDTGASKGESGSGGGGLNQVEIVDASGAPALVSKDTPTISSEPEAPYETAFFSNGGAALNHRFYLVPSSLKRIVVTSISSPIELIVRPISGRSVKVFMRCANVGGQFELTIQPLTMVWCAAADSSKDVLVRAGTILLLPPNVSFSTLPKEQARTSGFTTFKLAADLTIPSSQGIWGIAE